MLSLGEGLCFSVKHVGTLDRAGSPIPQNRCCDEQACGFKALGQKPVLSESVNNGSTQNVLVDVHPLFPGSLVHSRKQAVDMLFGVRHHVLLQGRLCKRRRRVSNWDS